MEKTTHTTQDDKSLGSLVTDLTREITTLFRQEIGLARAEISEKAGQAQSGITALIIGGAIAYAGLLILLASAVFGLSRLVDPWLAALVVAICVLIIGMIMIARAKSQLTASNLVPRKSIDQLKRDKSLAEQHTTRNHAAKQHTA